MHELSIASAVVATVERHAAGRRTSGVTVRIGRLRQVIPESLELCFEFAARGSLCEGATLEVQLVPARLSCAACGQTWELNEPVFRCPECASPRVEIVAGHELEVDSIVVEEEVCIAPR